MCTDRLTDRNSDYLISIDVHYLHLGGDKENKNTRNPITNKPQQTNVNFQVI